MALLDAYFGPQPVPVQPSVPQALLPVAVGVGQIIVTALLAFILWRLTYIIFVRNAEQKIAERQAAWYLKVVVDPQLCALNKFYESARTALVAGASACERAKANGNSAEVDQHAGATISGFNELLLPAQRELSDALGCFSEHLAQRISERCETLQDDVTNWFEELRVAAAADARVSLISVLSSFRTDVIKQLREYEFVEFGFQRPGLVRSLLWW